MKIWYCKFYNAHYIIHVVVFHCILIFTLFMAKYVKLTFVWLLAIYILQWNVYLNILPNLFFLNWVIRVIFSGFKLIIRKMIYKYILWFYGLYFHFLDDDFEEEMLSLLIESNLSFLWIMLFISDVRNLWLTKGHKDFLLKVLYF